MDKQANHSKRAFMERETPKDFELRVTMGQLEDALTSFFWLDVKRELEDIRENALEQSIRVADVDQWNMFKGRIQAIDMMLALPGVMMETLIDAQKTRELVKETKTT